MTFLITSSAGCHARKIVEAFEVGMLIPGKLISRAENKFPGTRLGPERPSTNTLRLSWLPLK